MTLRAPGMTRIGRRRAMLPPMSEHAFPPDGPRMLPAAILHHLLVRHPGGDRPENIARALFGPSGAAAARPHVARAVAGLRRAGLVDVRDGRVRPSRAARAFHALMAGGRAR